MGAAATQPVETDLKDAAEARYLNYALSVITSRALPDVRDGLKPVQRRILYAMYQNLRLLAGSRPRKSAAIVGEVLGKYHPHGDVAAYEAMVRMAQEFSLRYPLVHGEGNFGSLDGDGAAAYRYTEAKLTALAGEMMDDIGRETVPFRPTFDAMLDEPVVLPSGIPQLLMNGSTGIAVGMATNIPPHNLKEVIGALVAMIEEPDITVAGLLKYVKGPDFPTGGEILNTKKELREIYETGQGPVKLRGEYLLEDLPRGKRQIVITSIPYTVNKSELVEGIANEIMARKIPQILDVRDESTTDVRVVLELKADAVVDVAMAYLYKHTSLQTNFHVNLTCLVPTSNPAVGQPARVTLRELCRHFLDFRMEVVTNRLLHEKRLLEARLHILEGFLIILNDLDRAIKIIRASDGKADAATKLMAAFKLDDIQVDAILEMRLYQLAKLEIAKVEKEYAEKKKRLKEIEALLKNEKARWKMIREELEAIGEKYADKRRTSFAAGEELAYDPTAYIVQEEATVVLSRDGWIKRVREVKDPNSLRIREGDAVFTLLAGTTLDRIVLYSSHGSLYVIKVADVPATSGYGEPLQSILKFGDGERVVAARMIYESAAPPPPAAETKGQASLFGGPAKPAAGAVVDELLVATAKGYGFRATPELSDTTRAGRRLARVADDDEVIAVLSVRAKQAILATAKGKMLRFAVDEVPVLTGPGRGVILMRPDDDDRIVGAVVVGLKEKFWAVTSEGGERDFAATEVPLGKRAQKGMKVVKRGGVAALRGEDD